MSRVGIDVDESKLNEPLWDECQILFLKTNNTYSQRLLAPEHARYSFELSRLVAMYRINRTIMNYNTRYLKIPAFRQKGMLTDPKPPNRRQQVGNKPYVVPPYPG